MPRINKGVADPLTSWQRCGNMGAVYIYRQHANRDAANAWVEEDLGEDWVAAYRITSQNGRPVVAEVRVFPRPPHWEPRQVPERDEVYRPPGEWEASTKGTQAAVPPGGIPTTVLRQIRLGPIYEFLASEISAQSHRQRAARLKEEGLTEYAEAARSLAEVMAYEASEMGFDDFVRHPGRRGRDDLFYARLAARYVSLLVAGSQAPIRDLARELRDAGHDFSDEYVRQLINNARGRRDLLTEAPPGRAGGELTPKARRLLAEAQETDHKERKRATKAPGKRKGRKR
jgi:hypothetical protein